MPPVNEMERLSDDGTDSPAYVHVLVDTPFRVLRKNDGEDIECNAKPCEYPSGIKKQSDASSRPQIVSVRLSSGNQEASENKSSTESKHTHTHRVQFPTLRYRDREGELAGWLLFTVALFIYLAINLPLFVLSVTTMTDAPMYTLQYIHEDVAAAKLAFAQNLTTPAELEATIMHSQQALASMREEAHAIWHYTLVAFAVATGILLMCTCVFVWLYNDPHVRAMGKLFLVQFVVGSLLYSIFDLVYVGTSLLQVVPGFPPSVMTMRNVAFAMLACRTIIGSLAFSCFCMRQRVIFKIFNKLSLDPQRVYLEAFVFFTLVSTVCLIPQTVATFVPGQTFARYRFLSIYLIWVIYTVPFYYWTLKTTQASRRFNDYHSNIRVHMTLTIITLTGIIYSTFHSDSIVSVIVMGYAVRGTTTVYALELASKALLSKFYYKTPLDRVASVRSRSGAQRSASGQRQSPQASKDEKSAPSSRGQDRLTRAELSGDKIIMLEARPSC